MMNFAHVVIAKDTTKHIDWITMAANVIKLDAVAQFTLGIVLLNMRRCKHEF
jgi:hypothetical protein